MFRPYFPYYYDPYRCDPFPYVPTPSTNTFSKLTDANRLEIDKQFELQLSQTIKERHEQELLLARFNEEALKATEIGKAQLQVLEEAVRYVLRDYHPVDKYAVHFELMPLYGLCLLRIRFGDNWITVGNMGKSHFVARHHDDPLKILRDDPRTFETWQQVYQFVLPYLTKHIAAHPSLV